MSTSLFLNAAGDGPSDSYITREPDEAEDLERDEDGPSACECCTMRSERNCRQCQKGA